MSRHLPAFAAIAIVVFSGCALTRSASMTVARDGTDSVFHFHTGGINGLLSLRLWRTDTKEVFWDANLNYDREGRLKYGEIPTEFRTFNGGYAHGTF